MTVDQILDAVRACAQGQEPSIDISILLRDHKCYGMIIPKDDAKGQMERIVNLVAIKARYRSCESFFKNATFPYAVIKGAVLSSVMYNDPTLRVSGDIDILIRRQDADEAKRLMRSLGFIQGRITDRGIEPFSRQEILYQTSTSHQMAPFVRETGNPFCPYINVDINTDILWGECEYRADMDEVLSQKEKYTLFNIDFYKLTSEMEFIALCLHHYKDMNSIYLLAKGGLNLGLFCDIYFYLRNLRPSIEKIRTLSQKLNVVRYIYVCLVHTVEIFADPILCPYIEALEDERDASLLNSFGLNDKERKQWDITLAERLFHANLLQYIHPFLTDADIKKICINYKNM